jgi:hypothetical protein
MFASFVSFSRRAFFCAFSGDAATCDYRRDAPFLFVFTM